MLQYCVLLTFNVGVSCVLQWYDWLHLRALWFYGLYLKAQKQGSRGTSRLKNLKYCNGTWKAKGNKETQNKQRNKDTSGGKKNKQTQHVPRQRTKQSQDWEQCYRWHPWGAHRKPSPGAMWRVQVHKHANTKINKTNKSLLLTKRWLDQRGIRIKSIRPSRVWHLQHQPQYPQRVTLTMQSTAHSKPASKRANCK